ncbi:hypothetical protein [Rhodopirellula baltica]
MQQGFFSKAVTFFLRLDDFMTVLPRKCTLALVCLIGGFASNVRAESPRPPQTVAEHRYVQAIRPVLHQAHNARLEAYWRRIGRIRQDLIATQSQAGLEAFADAVLSLSSKSQMALNPSAHKRWVMEQFRKHVMQSEAMHRVIEIHTDQLEQEWSDIDDKLLIQLEADCELKDLQLQGAAIDPGKVSRHLDAISGDVMNSIYKATAKGIGSFAAGAAAGGVMHGALRKEHGRDGSISWMDELRAALGGLIVDIAVDAAVSELTQAKPTLISEIQSLRGKVLSGFTTKQPLQNDAISGELAIVFNRHSEQLVRLISESTSIDVSWAMSQY